ncbi:MAG TPA: CpXC domain-containing protein [Allosphingosinicella sp.]|jgi:hypothetical protein
MAIVYPYIMRCRCGETITANLADGVNVGRTPQVRDEILSGKMHRVSCPACRGTFTAEKSFLYSDLTRGTFIQVKPRHDRHLYVEASQRLSAAVANVPEELAPKRKLRVVFGMAELREKLVAEELGVDDRGVEMLKVMVLNDHPFLLHRPRLRIMLAGATSETLDFAAAYDLDDRRQFRLSLPRAAAEALAADAEKLRRWSDEAGHKRPIFGETADHWVNFWRWSPQPSALDELRRAAAELRAGRPVDSSSRAFARMLAGLPSGTQLPGWAKQDLQLLFDEAKRVDDEVLQDRLFEIRFGKTLASDSSSNADDEDIDTLWNLLRALPESDVAGNTSIADINLDVGADGGFYRPSTGDIYIGSRLLSDRENFEDVVRHEVGHGVHESRSAEVDGWLADQFGWHMLSPDRQGFDEWIALMGGWEAFDVSEAERPDILRYIQSVLGNGSSWNPGPTPNVPAGHGWWSRDFGPRLAYERTGSNWYMNHPRWYRRDGRAFFLNYWYRTLCVVDESTLALVARMPSSYAAMSTFEFFAELYALYHDLDDPLRTALPQRVIDWFERLVGPPREMRPGPPRTREGWETIDRPA